MQRFANPYIFASIVRYILPIVSVLAFMVLGYGLYLGLYISPSDYQQGDAVRIMYVHVPSAYNAMSAYFVMALSSAIYLIYRHPLADICARAASLPGLIFTGICLLSGSFWGKPIWGTWWAWDARMTSVLVLFFLYWGYMVLRRSFRDSESGRRPACILALVGAINLPIIKFSVEWWNSLHQPASLFRFGGVSLDGAILYPLLVMLVGSQLWLLSLILLRMFTFLAEQKIRRIENLGIEDLG